MAYYFKQIEIKRIVALVILLSTTCLRPYSQTKIDSLMQLCTKADDKNKAKLYLELSLNLRNDTATSNNYSQMALKLAKKNNVLSEQGLAYYYLGETTYYANNYSKAIPYYEKSLHIFEQIKDTVQMANCYNSIGLCHHKMSRGKEAIANLIKTLALCENDKEMYANTLNNIAMAHSKMGNDKYAIEYYKKALAANQSAHDSISVAINYNGLGQAYDNLHKHDSSLYYFSKAYHIFKTKNKATFQAIALANMASQYAHTDSLAEALNCLNTAQKMFEQQGTEQYNANLLITAGNILEKQDKINEAIAAYNKSLVLGEKHNLGFQIKASCFSNLSDAYEKIANYKKALEYHKLFNSTLTDYDFALCRRY